MGNNKYKNFFGVLFQGVLVALAFYIPVFELHFDIATVLTVLSLLFAILLGFFIAAATSNYLRMQSIIASEDAQLISMYNLVKILQPSAAKKLADLIDAYLIAILDFDLLGYVPHTKKYWQEIMSLINSVRPVSKYYSDLLQNLFALKDANTAIRQETELMAQRIVSKRHWFILILLSLLIAFLLLALRNGDFFASLVAGLIVVSLYQVLRLLHEIDSNSFLANKLGYESPQEVFLAIGKEKYYPECALHHDLKKKLSGENYRVGVYTNYPKSFEKKIRRVMRSSV